MKSFVVIKHRLGEVEILYCGIVEEEANTILGQSQYNYMEIWENGKCIEFK